MQTIGIVIKSRRKEKQLSQEALARLVGVSKNSIVAWETSKYSPSGQTLLEVMEILDLEKKDFEVSKQQGPPGRQPKRP